MKKTIIDNNYFKQKLSKKKNNNNDFNQIEQISQIISFYENEIWNRWESGFQKCKKSTKKTILQQKNKITDSLLTIQNQYPYLESYHFDISDKTLHENSDSYNLYKDTIEAMINHLYKFNCIVPKKYLYQAILDILYLTLFQLKKIYIMNRFTSLLDINYNPLSCMFEHLTYNEFIIKAKELLFKDSSLLF